ncbi:uncharacterized protein LOC122721401 [Manihot esculenta]|uniref:uncharacterized protein LOC122721401 n=1 Tax=Manihot esculenta TaxID=3983 RepID=UPI001CC3EDDD|nr:uncharacterized protein LOC122721401 [Manihot esculenta]
MEGSKLPDVSNLESNITPSTITKYISRRYLDTPLYYIRAPLQNERIVLPNPSPSGLIDPQKGRSLVFFLKQRDFSMTFPFTPFFIEVFQYFGITPRMLSPNSILFMSCFESICLSWGFTPTACLFVTFFCLVRAIQNFYYFALRGGLSLFKGYKDSIKGWVESFLVAELRKETDLSWGVGLDWEDVPLGCNDLPQLSLTEQVGYLRLTSVDKKYDVGKCMFVSNLRDIRDTGIVLCPAVLFFSRNWY